MGEPVDLNNAPLARPTSAPPVLEISRASLFAFTDTRADLARIFTDIRCDENYPSFYEDFQQANGDGTALPPPLEAPIVQPNHSSSRAPTTEQAQPTPQRTSLQGFMPAWTPFQAATEYDWQQDLRRAENPAARKRTSNPGTQDISHAAPAPVAHPPSFPPRTAPLPAPAALPHLVRPVAPAPLIPIPSSNGSATRAVPASPGGAGLSRKLEQLSLDDFGLEEPPLPDFSSDSDGAALSSTDDLNGSSPALPSLMEVSSAFPGSGLLFGRVERDVRRIWDDPPATVVVPSIRTTAPTDPPPVVPTTTTPPAESRETCRYFQQGFCSRGDRCQFLHAMHPPAVVPAEQSLRRTPPPPEQNNTSPVPAKRNSGKSRGMNGSANGYAKANGGSSISRRKEEEIRRARSPPAPPMPVVPAIAAPAPGAAAAATTNSVDTAGFTSIDQALGGIYALCKDQHGCRFLQKQIEERTPRVLDAIFAEVYPHFVELMTDPFGNYLCQKLLECCPERQRVALIEAVSPHLVAISHNMHGTRAVQKMIEFLSTPQMVALVVAGLRANVVALIQDLNGNHVIQRCLQRLTPPDNQFIYDAVSAHCVQVATHRHGCCVLQRCIDYASESQKRQLMAEVIRNAHTLVRDAFGNYVVQYIMDLPYPDVGNQLARRFQGHVADLSTQKFSSNVIEKCLKAADRPTLTAMITELTDGEALPMLLQDPYGNYVVQTALSLADPETHKRMVALIRPHLPAIRNTPYGKRIQNKITKESKASNHAHHGHGHGHRKR